GRAAGVRSDVVALDGVGGRAGVAVVEAEDVNAARVVAGDDVARRGACAADEVAGAGFDRDALVVARDGVARRVRADEVALDDVVAAVDGDGAAREAVDGEA